MKVHNKPSARQIQPTGLRGRLKEIRAPTTGKARKGTKTNKPAIVRSAPQLTGTGAERARRRSTTLIKNMATERAASDQASQVAVRVRILPIPRLCSRAPSVTTLPLYSTTVSQPLRHTLRTDTLEEYLPAQATHETTRTWGWHRGCGGGEYKSIHQL